MANAPYTSTLRSLTASVYLPTFLFAVGQGAVIPIVALQAKSLGASLAVAGFIVALRGIGVLAFDVGAHTHQIASQWTAHGPKTFLITNGWSSMGFGLPAALAAKIARPDLPVVCVMGDGCFQMTCGELTVARRMGLALPVVVLDDRWLSLIKVKQERRDLPYYGTTTLAPTDMAPPAHYFGVPAVGVRDPESLERELRKAFASSGPTVIEAVVDPAHYSETVYD